MQTAGDLPATRMLFVPDFQQSLATSNQIPAQQIHHTSSLKYWLDQTSYRRRKHNSYEATTL